MSSLWLFIAALDGALFVVLGAAGGHGVVAEPDLLRLFDTAADYHAVHALALLSVSVVVAQTGGLARVLAGLAGALFVLGSVLFCGALYLHAFSGAAVVGPLTPVGGGLLIVGWLILAAAGLAAWRRARA